MNHYRALRTAAEHATKGRWIVREFSNYQGFPALVGASIETDDTVVAEVRGAVVIDGNRHEEHTANALFIALANPETILGLLDNIERAWIPIAMAPRDGTEVDLWRDGERLIGYGWSERHRSWVREHGYPTVTNVLTKQPTHFMFAPPKPPSGGESE
ncbi:ead/Ea22-like family protein [Caulobacter vibrioides]|uniref:ead/Ea22-like family protein n=1 Tax=Caulobacter vibrioides TaxID=155892 RepID=UPI000BB526C2|nr:ead/Ea22-like family protein [Caulobacter vibrioides]ATC25181.1 hypothetical protein CA608_11915 [Caulobacter vibrioides]PLR13952.1 hypothetical protein CVUC_05220 [Caulobacter vibrioides]